MKPYSITSHFWRWPTTTRNGIAVLRLDDRGVSKSGGKGSLVKTTTKDFSDDTGVKATDGGPGVQPAREGDMLAGQGSATVL